jgi:hypothetical protein
LLLEWDEVVGGFFFDDGDGWAVLEGVVDVGCIEVFTA